MDITKRLFMYWKPKIRRWITRNMWRWNKRWLL